MRKLSEYKEPNFIELLWTLLIQWKGVLVFAIIFGFLGMALFYVRDSRSAAAGISEEVQIQTSVQNQTDLIAVNSILNQEAAVNDYQEYYTSSVLMKIDPYHIPVHILQYHIALANDCPDGMAQIIASTCCSDTTIYRIAENLKDAWHSETDTSYLAELIHIESTSTSAATNADLSVRVFIPAQMDSTIVDKATDDALRSVSSDLSGKLPSYSLTLLSSADIIDSDPELAEIQRDHLKEAGELERILALSRNQLTDSQKKLYTELKDNSQHDNNLLREGIGEETILTVPAAHLSKKGFAYGFIFGVLIYIVLYLLRLIFNRHIQTPAKIRDVLGYRTIGELYVFPYYSGIRKFFSSKTIYCLHHRGKTDPGKQLDDIQTAISSLCTYYALSTSHLVSLGKQPEHAAEYINAIVKKTEQSGNIHISHTALYVDGKIDSADHALATADAVIPVIFGNSTTDAMIDSLSEICQVYAVRVLGIIYIEC